MEFVNFEELIKSKIAECDEWLGGEEEARVALGEAEHALEEAIKALDLAKEALGEYNAENIERVKEYRKELRSNLGLVDEPEVVEEAPVAEEVPAVEVAVVDSTAPATIVNDNIMLF